jgi:hypothetical protein
MVHLVKVKRVDFDRVVHVVGEFKARDGRGVVREDGVKLDGVLVEVNHVVDALSLSVEDEWLKVVSAFESQLLGEGLVSVGSE